MQLSHSFSNISFLYCHITSKAQALHNAGCLVYRCLNCQKVGLALMSYQSPGKTTVNLGKSTLVLKEMWNRAKFRIGPSERMHLCYCFSNTFLAPIII